MFFEKTARKPDYILLVTVVALVGIGLVMVYSASFVEAYNLHNTQYYYLFRQMIGAVLGLGALFVFQNINYEVWKRYSIPIMGTALVLLVLVLILPETMTKVNDSRAWIRFGGGTFSMQPSEIAKLALIIYISNWLSQRSDRLSNVTYGLLPLAIILGIVCGLVMLEPDRGTTIILFFIAAAIYFVAGANLIHILGATGVSVTAFWLLINLAHQNARIAAFKDPWKYYDSYGYQPIHALYALGSGGIFGTGLGQGRQKFQWLPQAHTDAIFAILGEELGLIGTLIVLGGFALIAYRGFRIATRSTDPFASLVAVGITTWIFVQAMINIAVTTSLIPFTGLTLPFLSYGGTSLIMCMAGIGILLNISRHTIPDRVEETHTHDVPMVFRSPALTSFVQRTRHNMATFLPEWGRHRRTRLPRARSRRSTLRQSRESQSGAGSFWRQHN
jgi:cell division protein FtsW